jgi:hypothetical protein
MALNLSFLDRSRFSLSSSSSFTVTRAEWTPFQTHCHSENLAAPGIKPGTSGLAARNFDHQSTQAVEKVIQLRLNIFTYQDQQEHKVNIGLMKLAACQLLFWYDRNSV